MPVVDYKVGVDVLGGDFIDAAAMAGRGGAGRMKMSYTFTYKSRRR